MEIDQGGGRMQHTELSARGIHVHHNVTLMAEVDVVHPNVTSQTSAPSFSSTPIARVTKYRPTNEYVEHAAHNEKD